MRATALSAAWEARVSATRALIDAGTPRIAGAAFEAHGAAVVVDLLERAPSGRWTIVLIRNAVRVSWALADRGALALHVVRGAGVPVGAVHALLLDPSYVRTSEEVVPSALFARRSMSFAARRRLARVSARTRLIVDTLGSDTAPRVEPGAHCREDRDGCPFLADCTASLPEDWTGWAPRKDGPPIRDWLAAGHVRMRDLPDDTVVTRGVAQARLASRAGGRQVSSHLAEALEPTGPPAFYLDFECVSTGVPRYLETSPYATVPFLWSVHHVDVRGALTHVDDIAPPTRHAPRRRMAEGLLAALGTSTEPIVVYSSYERERLDELIAVLPDLEAPLRAVQARLVDLLEVVREHVYDLQFRGSFSMKQVAPALVPDLGYEDLAIRDGLAATQAYERLLTQANSEAAGVEQTLADLRAYCARDTFVMVRLHRALHVLAMPR